MCENKIDMEKQGLSTNTLKIIAIAAMVCDHAPYIAQGWQELYYVYPWFLLHAVGRITAPVFFFLLAMGYRRTRDANRYTLRLLIFACISYVPYIWYFEGALPNKQNFLELNVIFTMLVGLLLLRSVYEIKNIVLKVVCVILCILIGYWCDFGLYGIAMILICDLCRESRLRTVLGIGALMMTYIGLNIGRVFANSTGPFEYIAQIEANARIAPYMVVILCLLLPLIFIAFHRKWYPGAVQERRPSFLAKWGFYIFYPAHITVFLLIRLYLL